MSISLSTKNLASTGVDGQVFHATITADSTIIQNEVNRHSLAVDPEHNANGTHKTVNATEVVAPSITLGGVQRNTWPAAGDSTVGIDDVLNNGHATTQDRMELGGLKFGAISATLPAITLVDYCFHLAKDDTDKGAWRKRKGQSWRSEARSAGRYLGSYATASAAVTAGGTLTDVYYNTTNSRFEEITATGTPASTVTYRAGKEDYPTNALITAQAARVIIWDLDGAVPTMWMVFTATTGAWGTTAILLNGAVASVAAVNSKIVIGAAAFGIYAIDFIADEGYGYRVTASQGKGNFNGDISTRNSTLGYMTVIATSQVVSDTVNDVAITVLPDAPLDEYGMPVPTIAVATGGGISVVQNSGSVVNSASTAAHLKVVFDKNGYVICTQTSGGANYKWSQLPASSLGAGWSLDAISTATIPALISGMGNATAMTDSVVAGVGVSIMRRSNADYTKSLMAHVSTTHNSGWMVGDIRRAFLANSKTADRSVKAGTLTEVGTVTETTYSGGRSVYSGFSASNYLQEASHADWNALGTGDFSIIMSGVKWGTAGVAGNLLSMGDAGAGAFVIHKTGGNAITVYTNTGTWVSTVTSGAVTFTDTAEHVLEVKRSGTTMSLLVDGIVIASTTGGAAANSISRATGYLRIGNTQDSVTFTQGYGGQVSCVRISATAPTAEQSKFIAQTENALNGGATCLLSNSSTVSALYPPQEDGALGVKNGTNTDWFVDLKRIGAVTSADGVTISGNVPNRHLYTSGTANTFKQAERNVKAELLEAQGKPERRKLLDFNVVTNSKFSTSSGWTLGTGYTISDGQLVATGVLNAVNSYQITKSWEVGKSYVVTYTVSGYTAGGIRVGLQANWGTNRSANGTYTETVAIATTGTVTQFQAVGTTTLNIDNVFIRESTDKLPMGFKPEKVWAGGLLQEEGTDYYVTFDGFLYGIVFYIEPATAIQVEGVQQ